MSIITHLNVEVTRCCNQRCFYCFNESAAGLDHTPHEPSRWLRLLVELRAQGLRSVHLTGGEPFSWWGTVELLQGAQALRLSTSILSNGYRIPRLIAQDPEPFSRLRVAQISLDAITPDVHDARRGLHGAWIAAQQAIHALHTLRVPVEISAVVSDSNLEQVLPLASYCADLGAKLLIRPLLTLGRASRHSSTEDWNVALHEILDHVTATWPGILISDAFAYLPQPQGLGCEAPARGVATVHCEGLLRSDTAEMLRLPESHFLGVLCTTQ